MSESAIQYWRADDVAPMARLERLLEGVVVLIEAIFDRAIAGDDESAGGER